MDKPQELTITYCTLIYHYHYRTKYVIVTFICGKDGHTLNSDENNVMGFCYHSESSTFTRKMFTVKCKRLFITN